MSNIRALYEALLPDGPIWIPKKDGDFDKLLDAMGENAGLVFDFLRTLANIRDPYNTPLLDDLEKEYGIIKNENLSEALRRSQIASIKYATPGTGSLDDLQDRLDKAGFDLIVTANDPAFDPRPILQSRYQMYAGGYNAYAGYNEGGPILAYAGFSGGYLIVNGDLYIQSPDYAMVAGGDFSFAGNSKALAGYFLQLDRDIYIYEIPDDPNRWRFIFFVGGPADGFQNILIDGNMEAHNTDAWTPIDPFLLPSFTYPITTELIKNTSVKNTGTRSLKVISKNNYSVQDLFSFTLGWPDISFIGSRYDVTGSDIVDFAPKIVIADGSMERSGVSDWTAVNNATLTKDQSAPYKGTRNLRIAYNGTSNPGATQGTLITGRRYQLIGAAKGDGTFAPRIEQPLGNVIWSGTASASWQGFSIIINASGSPNVYFFGNCNAAGYVEFDEIESYEMADLFDGDMEAVGVLNWSVGNSAIITKQTTDPHNGSQLLRVAYNGVADPYAYQAATYIDEYYHLWGFARSDGSSIPVIKSGSITVWTGTDSTDWQLIDIAFNAINTDLRFYCNGNGYVEFDDFQYYEDPTLFFMSPALGIRALTNVNQVNTPYGIGFDFDGFNMSINAGGHGNNIDDRFACSAIIKTSANKRQSIISKYSPSSPTFDFGIDENGYLYFYDGTTYFLSNDIVNDDQWHFVGVSINGSGSFLYIDLDQNGSTFTPNITLPSPQPILSIGARSPGSGNYFDGIIQAPRMIGQPVSLNDIKAIAGNTFAVPILFGNYSEQQFSMQPAGTIIKGYAWGDGNGSIPSVMYYDPVLVTYWIGWIGEDSPAKQYFEFSCPNGTNGILLNSGRVENGHAFFDDVFVGKFPIIDIAEVPTERRDELYRMILQQKPLHTWCGLVVDFV